jgi:site-specific recombinase XerD
LGSTRNTSNSGIVELYLKAMRTETNSSKSYEVSTKIILTSFSKFHDSKPFSRMDRDDVIAYLDSFRKSEKIDPLHKWIGTYNRYLTVITRFFRWLNNRKLEPRKRLKPEVVQNIQQLGRREQSIYKPTDLWSREDDLVFLKYCPCTS